MMLHAHMAAIAMMDQMKVQRPKRALLFAIEEFKCNWEKKGLNPDLFLKDVSVDGKIQPFNLPGDRQMGLLVHFGPRTPDKAEKKFRSLAKKWKEEARFLSSVSQMAMLPSYQQIIGMGLEAVPFILQELEKGPDHWFWALQSIVGIDPIPSESRGKVDEMAAAWVNWGRSQRLI